MGESGFAKGDEGVSAVIGVILMVAITVILAAVIAAFVFGTANGVNNNYFVTAKAERTSASQIIVTYFGGPDCSHVTSLTVRSATGSATTGSSIPTTIGSSTIITGAGADDTVTVTATWDYGSSSVILIDTL